MREGIALRVSLCSSLVLMFDGALWLGVMRYSQYQTFDFYHMFGDFLVYIVKELHRR